MAKNACAARASSDFLDGWATATSVSRFVTRGLVGCVRYAGIRRDDVELHLQWHDAIEWTCPHPHDRPNYRFFTPDVDTLFAEPQAAGVLRDARQVADTPWGTREFHLYDPDKNGLQFYRDL
jgi:hypothetical protein